MTTKCKGFDIFYWIIVTCCGYGFAAAVQINIVGAGKCCCDHFIGFMLSAECFFHIEKLNVAPHDGFGAGEGGTGNDK